MYRCLWWEMSNGPWLGDMEGDLLEGPNGCEIGAADGLFLGNFHLDPDSDMWKGFWSGIIDWTLAWGSVRGLGQKA